MLEVFSWMSKSFGRIVGFVFNDFVVIDSPRVTLGTFVLAFAVIGLVIYFLLGSDFSPFMGWSLPNKDKDNYKPRHAPGNVGKDFSTRESRHNYK